MREIAILTFFVLLTPSFQNEETVLVKENEQPSEKTLIPEPNSSLDEENVS